jgi:hypothetical protein
MDRVGGGIAPAVLPHHRTDRSVSGGSCRLCRTNICGSELGFVRCVAWRCYGHRDLLRDFRPLSPSLASVSPRNFCPIRSESTPDYPLVTASVPSPLRFQRRLRPLLPSVSPSQCLTVPVVRGRRTDFPGSFARPSLHISVGSTSPPSRWYRASSRLALSPRWGRLYPLAVRRTAVLLTASFRFHLGDGHPCCSASSSHHQGRQRTCTAKSTK